MTARRDVLIVGGGPSGVASALALGDAGVGATVLERADRVAAAWRRRYDGLRLNTARPLSHLPGRRFDPGTPIFPTRDDLVAHVEGQATRGGVDVRFGTPVQRIDREDGGWTARTHAGDLAARQVIVATGYVNDPVLPAWATRDGFHGRLLHSGDYRNPEPFRDQRVLVVGAGSSGFEIAHELATGGAERVWLAVRTPPNILLRVAPGGLPGDFVAVALMRLPVRAADAVSRFGRRMGVGDLTEFGLPVPAEGPMSRLRRLGVAPAIVDGEVIDAIRTRRFQIVPAVDALDGDHVRLADGSTLAVDAVVCATGYRCGLEPLVGHLGVLDERGRPAAVGETAAASGLRFIGYVPRPGALGYASKQAKRAAKAIARELRAAPARA